MSNTNTPRDVVIMLMTDVVLRWLLMMENSDKTENVGEMADRFLSLLNQHGYEIVPKRKP